MLLRKPCMQVVHVSLFESHRRSYWLIQSAKASCHSEFYIAARLVRHPSPSTKGDEATALCGGADQPDCRPVFPGRTAKPVVATHASRSGFPSRVSHRRRDGQEPSRRSWLT